MHAYVCVHSAYMMLAKKIPQKWLKIYFVMKKAQNDQNNHRSMSYIDIPNAATTQQLLPASQKCEKSNMSGSNVINQTQTHVMGVFGITAIVNFVLSRPMCGRE